MDNSEVNRLFRKKLLETFSLIQKFFEKHNIKYYACGGTALGAIRHKGLIPWDDDIDLYVPREDYDRLNLYNEELNKLGYNFVCFENNKNYYLPFGKIEDKNTTLWEVNRFKYITGVYVDIFPLDYFSGSKEDVINEQERYYNIYSNFQHSIEYTPIKEIFELMLFGHIPTAWLRIKSYLYHPFRKYNYKRLIEEIDLARKGKGEWCVCTPQWRGKVFKTEWFENAIEVPFENTTIKVPSEYDEYLTLLYGDYMTPPPLEKRVLAHDEYRYYLILKECIDYKEVLSRLKQGEKVVY